MSDTQQTLRQQIATVTDKFTQPGTKYLNDINDELVAAFEAYLKAGKLQRYTLQTGLLWDSQDATDGYHEALDKQLAAYLKGLRG